NVPRAYLVTLVTRLCLSELGTARARREESRSGRLPEPVDLGETFDRAATVEQVSMAFLVALQRLSPPERAVLLLHEVFHFDHAEIGRIVGRSVEASRKLLERAKRDIADEKRFLDASPEEHRRLLEAFLHASTTGDLSALLAILSEDAILVADAGVEG